MSDCDVLVVGGGHNALVAAAYLARTGLRVVVCEAAERFGGAVTSARSFAGVDVRLSRYSYLVSLLPQQIVDDLGLDLELRSRKVASYTPVGADGLLVERTPGPATAASWRRITGGDAELAAYAGFEDRLRRWAEVVAPTLTGPLPRAAEVRARAGADLWDDLVERPVGELLERTFADDTVRGMLLTDALIGTFASAHDASGLQNRCFTYHVVGRGTGEWRVPVGGMGCVADTLTRVAAEAGAELRSGCPVAELAPDDAGVDVVLADGARLRADHVIATCAPAALERLLGREAVDPLGSQTKVNLVLRRLPRFRSGVDPTTGFAGTLHLHQGYADLERAHAQAAAGRLPDPLPVEVYCHTLTDPSILGPSAAGLHTVTAFVVHTPSYLFADDPDGTRDRVRAGALASLQSVLAERLEDCLALDANGEPCVEVRTPLDLAEELRMPGGHIFHGDLTWPWLADDEPAETPAQRWGVATDHPCVLLGGSGSRRGGAVSGLGGHSAAMALLETRRPARPAPSR